MSSNNNATAILARLARGDPRAEVELYDQVYGGLRALAASYLRRRPAGQTLQATALVHEVYLKLVHAGSDWSGRAHFMAVAAKAMRQVLHDRARARRAAKRGGAWQRLTLSGVGQDSGPLVDLVALDDALSRLARLDERQYRIVELRFFAGLDVDEVAEVLQVSKSTVEKEWTRVRAWLSKELGDSTA